jgi:bifunctional non-homologous end joining protein LigD
MSTAFEPMVAFAPAGYTDPEPAMPSPTHWVMEPKLDGWRFVFHITGHGRVEAYGRRGSLAAYSLPAYLTDELVARFPPDSIVDAELVVEGTDKQSTDVAVVLADHRAGRLIAYVFDVMRCAGIDTRDLPWTQRRWVIDKALSLADGPVRLNLVTSPDIEVFKAWLLVGVEGAVLKRRDSPYRGGRSRDWLKLKPQHTVDVTITGFQEGAGKRACQMATIEFTHNGTACVATVCDWDLGQAMFVRPQDYLGRIAEVAYHVGRAKGQEYLRHPVVTRMRPDLEEVAE